MTYNMFRLEIQRLQLAGSSPTVFAVNLILYNQHYFAPKTKNFS